MLNASCSINLTPSHNPANYGGFKFNPSDGGPAGPEITSRIQEVANAMMKEAGVLEPLLPDEVEDIDLTSLYIDYLKKKGTIDLNKIRDFINKADCLICIDNVHGATRGRIQRILGESDRIVYLRTDDDPLFGGVAPEPSEKNMQGVMDVLGRSTSRFKLGVIMDPDGDRIRHADGERIIFMNYFGAMAFHYLHTYKGFKGVVVKSVGTSEFVDAIASAHGVPVRETKVGFKNFRPFMVKDAKERAIVCFEESDGISGYNHTLEKDALFGTLLAIEMMATTGKNLSEYLDDLMNTYGHYYPDRSGIEVDRSMSGELLKHKISTLAEKYTPGTILHTGATTYTVKEIITKDGVKMVFDNGAWIMIRPSGTEPKVRFYIDARSEDEKAILFETAERITREALGIS
jgi:phosphomannomutase